MVKPIKYFLSLAVIFIILALFLESCRTTQKAALSCPELSMNKTSKNTSGRKMFRNKSITAHYRAKTRKQIYDQSAGMLRKNHGKGLVLFKNLPVITKVKGPGAEYLNDFSKIEFLNGLMASITNTAIPPANSNITFHSLKKVVSHLQHDDLNNIQPSACDTVFLRSGSWMVVRVVEIGRNKIYYRSCDSLSGPAASISKSEVSRIISSNNTLDYFTTESPAGFYNNNAKKVTDPIGIVGFISTLAGLFSYLPGLGITHPLLFFILNLIGLILGGISNSITKKQPGKFKGRGFAKFSIIVGVTIVIAIVVSLMLMMIYGF